MYSRYGKAFDGKGTWNFGDGFSAMLLLLFIISC